MKTTTISACLVAALVAPPALAQTPPMLAISPEAGYDLSLRCYQYYDVEAQIAQARAARARAGSSEAAELDKRLSLVRAFKAAWNRSIETTKGDRSGDVIDADLLREGAPVIADANAGLAGDRAAADRVAALHAACRSAETVSGG
jgi:hypothetical protein